MPPATVFAGSTAVWAGIVAGLAAGLLATGSYRAVERVLVWLVVLMGFVFLVTALIVTPDFGDLLAGFVPTVPSGSTLTVLALIGTTVVPYNLFLHASSVQDKWPEDIPTDRAVREAKLDTRLSIGFGGLVTLAILTTAAAALFSSGRGVASAGDMATQLEPLLGPAAKYFFASGLLAAGITSSVTAPLAAAYATAGALGWRRDLSDPKFKAVWAAIILVGVIFAFMGSSPTQAIVFAQAANGIILPIIAVFLLVVMNRRDLLGDHVNSTVANIVGVVVVLVAIVLGARSLLTAFGVI
jgi:manganese transport protein